MRGKSRADDAHGYKLSQSLSESAPWIDGFERQSRPQVKSDPAPLTRYVNNPMLTTQNGYSAAALKLWSTVFESFGATVTFWSCSPSFSWTKAIV